MITGDFPLEDESVKKIFVESKHGDEFDLKGTISCVRA